MSSKIISLVNTGWILPFYLFRVRWSVVKVAVLQKKKKILTVAFYSLKVHYVT